MKRLTLRVVAITSFVMCRPLLAQGNLFTITATNLNLRPDPSTFGAPIELIPKGTSLLVDSCFQEWCFVFTEKNVGYVSATYLRIREWSGDARRTTNDSATRAPVRTSTAPRDSAHLARTALDSLNPTRLEIARDSEIATQRAIIDRLRRDSIKSATAAQTEIDLSKDHIHVKGVSIGSFFLIYLAYLAALAIGYFLLRPRVAHATTRVKNAFGTVVLLGMVAPALVFLGIWYKQQRVNDSLQQLVASHVLRVDSSGSQRVERISRLPVESLDDSGPRQRFESTSRPAFESPIDSGINQIPQTTPVFTRGMAWTIIIGLLAISGVVTITLLLRSYGDRRAGKLAPTTAGASGSSPPPPPSGSAVQSGHASSSAAGAAAASVPSGRATPNP